MGKIERKVELEQRVLDQLQASGLTLEQAVTLGVEAARDKPLGIVANAERQKLDPQGAEDRARKWAEENADAIKAYNERIRRRGVFGTDLRRW